MVADAPGLPIGSAGGFVGHALRFGDAGVLWMGLDQAGHRLFVVQAAEIVIVGPREER